ncbi:MAG: putative kinase inhibitor [Syntrophorhabdus sp. PtaU1.Bin058]|nr:MAG: putative kinase inhibitor [Syntrophorhabdus sp. PtaU1.Bin058]
MRCRLLVLFFICIFLFCSGGMPGEVIGMGTLRITSPVFGDNGHIPRLYTCDGKDVNPALMIENVPGGAKSLALIVDDPDAPAGTWVHWVLWNIDPRLKEIKENSVPPKSVQGKNDFGKNNYGGPCPPSGTHRYFFKFYALDTVLNLSPDSTKFRLEKEMKGHILAEGRIVGLYKR